MNLKKLTTLGYHYFLTLIIYKPFLKKSGKRFILIAPIWITSKYLVVGDNVVIRNGARIEGVDSYAGMSYNPIISIGNEVKIQQNLHLTCAEAIEIGDDTAIAANVSITDIDHNYTDIAIAPERQSLNVLKVTISKNCKIYNNAVILPGTIMGQHCIVGANSVVKGTFPAFCVIAGAPAKIIKRYNSNTLAWERTDSQGNFLI